MKIKPGTEFKDIKRIRVTASSQTNTGDISLEWQNIKKNGVVKYDLNSVPGTVAVITNVSRANGVNLTREPTVMEEEVQIDIGANTDEIELTLIFKDADERYWYTVTFEGDGSGEEIESFEGLDPETAEGLKKFQSIE